jgi:hypothetical protein
VNVLAITAAAIAAASVAGAAGPAAAAGPSGLAGAGLAGAGPAGAGLAGALGADAAPHARTAAAEHESARPRVVVADGARGTIRVLDLAGGRRVGPVLRVAGPAALTTAGDGRHVLAAQGAQNRVDALDGGAWSQAHGDHAHHHTATPRLLPFRLSIAKPSHVVPHGAEVAIFSDGGGEAQVFGAAALRRPARPLATVRTGTPHHGVAVPLGTRVAISVADPAGAAGELPPHLEVRDRAGATLARADCPQLHGETAGAGWAAFGCADGIALLTLDGAAAPRSAKLSYPAQGGEQQRAFALQSDARGRRIVGSFGPRALVVIERASGAGRVVAVAGTIASFAVDARTGAIVVLGTDGLLRRIDPASGRQTAARRVVGAPFRAVWDRPSPKLVARGGLVAVSDPARARVAVLRVAARGALKPVRTLRVPGAPTSVAFAGIG